MTEINVEILKRVLLRMENQNIQWGYDQGTQGLDRPPLFENMAEELTTLAKNIVEEIASAKQAYIPELREELDLVVDLMELV